MADDRPRILCLHGGGASSHIFELQMRHFIRKLGPSFRLVFADGPWLSEMHDDLKAVYSDYQPCRRWACWLPQHPPLNALSAIDQIEDCLETTMNEDNGIGEWVGLLGFSQGAKLAFSILLENQSRLKKDPRSTVYTGIHWRFGILMAGRAPPYNLGCNGDSNNYCDVTRPSSYVSPHQTAVTDKLQTPTLHVHGLQDGGLEMHRDLLNSFCSPTSNRLIEWDGAHRIPFKTTDVDRIAKSILDVAIYSQLLTSNNKTTKETTSWA